MGSRLRIHRDDQASTFAGDPVPDTLPFPMKAVRERLVAGMVSGDPKSEAPAFGCERADIRVRWGEDGPGVIRFPGMSGIGRDADVTTSSELMSQIEQTLERMQQRLESFREQLDETFKFPAARGGGLGDDDNLPPAA